MDEMQMIRETLTAAPPPAESTARARAALLDRAQAVRMHQQTAERRRNPPISWRWSLAGLGLTGAVAAALVVPMLVAPATPSPDRPTTSPDGPTASQEVVVVTEGTGADVVLRLAAANAPAEQPVQVRSGQYIYTRTTQSWLSVEGDVDGGGPLARIVETGTHEGWYLPEGMRAVYIRVLYGKSRVPLTPGDAAKAKKIGYDLTAPPEVMHDGPEPEPVGRGSCMTCPATARPGSLHHPSPEYLASLPTDPAQLLATLRGVVGDVNKHSPDQQVFTAILDLLRQADPIMPANLRAALYQAVARIPGVVRINGQVDLDGQKGIAIGRVGEATSDPNSREELVFDAAGRRLIGFRTVQVKATKIIPAGTVISWSTQVHSVVGRPGHAG